MPSVCPEGPCVTLRRRRALPGVRRGLLLALLPALVALLPIAAPRPGAAQAGGSDPSRLKRLSIEELMEIDVTSVSKRSERLSTAAAAITVITQDDIRRSGAATLPEALRLAGALAVARFDSRTHAISARGFNITTANKLLVLVDGRSIYTPLFSGVFWDAQDVLLPDVERIEVIRGPGATLWGANAVNGVINVITKRAQDTQGGLFRGDGGDEQLLGGMRWGGELAGGPGVGYYRTYVKYLDEDALALPGGVSARDPVRRGQGGFRLDWENGERDGYTVQGDLYQGTIGHPALDDTDIRGGNVLARWSRRLSGGSQLTVQSYYDRTYRRVPAQFEETRDTFDVEAQHRTNLRGRHDVLWGMGYRISADDVTDSPVVSWVPPSRTQNLFNLFAQDEVALGERLRLTFGSKFEVNDDTGLEVQPSVRLAWLPTPRQTVWGAVSRAVRTPTRLDRDVRFTTPTGAVLLAGSEDFRAEDLLAFELGWRVQPDPRVSIDLALYRNSYDDLRSQEPPPGGGVPIVLANNLNAETQGLELAFQYQMTPHWRWQADAVLFDKDLSLDPGSRDPTGGLGEGNDFRHQYQLRSSLDLPGNLELDGFLRRVGPLPSPEVPAYSELDLRLGWRARPDLDLALVGRNLLHGQHPEFGPDGAGREEVERSLSGRVIWRF